MTAPRSGKHERNGVIAPAQIESLSFDELLEKLEEIVQQLETDELSLDASIGTFEHGVALAARCQQLLNDAELRISRITDEIGETSTDDVSDDRLHDIDDEEL